MVGKGGMGMPALATWVAEPDGRSADVTRKRRMPPGGVHQHSRKPTPVSYRYPTVIVWSPGDKLSMPG